MKHVRFYVDSKSGINYELYIGNINTDDLIGLKERIKLEKEYCYHNDTILDLREASLDMSVLDLKRLGKFFEQFKEPGKIRRVAYLTSSPKTTSYSMLFSQIIGNKNDDSIHHNTLTCATTAALNEWLARPDVSEAKLNSVFDQLRQDCAH